ncbi:MAG: ROK family protein, partial [Lachnospiraceae bacterium]|nr:ROK family protein [Lachnospiraceae bacterium]
MELFNVKIDVKNKPVLDPGFIPVLKYNRAFLKDAKKPVSIAVERADGQMATVHTYIHGTENMREADRYYINRLAKTLLWMKGGFKIYVSGDEDIASYLADAFAKGGIQDFDNGFMANVYEHPFEVVSVDKVPETKDSPKRMGGHMNGCRIGFDAGGSDRKVSALIDGESVFSEEVVWFPKTNSDLK